MRPYFRLILMKLLLFLVATLALAPLAQAQASQDSAAVESVARYRLYPTRNWWIFLKLDTRNGRIWLVQWNFDKEKRFETSLSFSSRCWPSEEVDGRFALVPTSNLYNFILLDQVNGKTWQVQWSTEYENRGVLPISGP